MSQTSKKSSFQNTEETPQLGWKPHQHNSTTTETKWRNWREKTRSTPNHKSRPLSSCRWYNRTVPLENMKTHRKDKPREHEAHQRSYTCPEKTIKAERPNTTRRAANRKTREKKRKLHRCQTRSHTTSDQKRRSDLVFAEERERLKRDHFGYALILLY